MGKERGQFGRNSWRLYQARPEDCVVTFAGFCWIVQPALVHPHNGATRGDNQVAMKAGMGKDQSRKDQPQAQARVVPFSA